MCINSNTVINNNCRKLQDFTVPLKISYGHAKNFPRNLQTIRSRAIKKVCQPWTRTSVKARKATWKLFKGCTKWLEGRSGYGSSVNVSCIVSSGNVYSLSLSHTFIFWNWYIRLRAKEEEFILRPIEHVSVDSVIWKQSHYLNEKCNIWCVSEVMPPDCTTVWFITLVRQ
jgi:hypothetical protein